MTRALQHPRKRRGLKWTRHWRRRFGSAYLEEGCLRGEREAHIRTQQLRREAVCLHDLRAKGESEASLRGCSDERARNHLWSGKNDRFDDERIGGRGGLSDPGGEGGKAESGNMQRALYTRVRKLEDDSDDEGPCDREDGERAQVE